MNTTYLRQLLLGNIRQLHITADGFATAMMEAFPLSTPSSFFFNPKPPTYQELSEKVLATLQKELKVTAETKDINITSEYGSQDLPLGSIAYHRIWGFITSSSYWYFSSKQFEKDLLEADSNPAIHCHFLHVNSPGGEAWYLDRLSETMKSLSKPIVALVEYNNSSAAYHITCHSDFIATLTSYDHHGCIGTMMSTYDFSGYYEKLGIKQIVVKATKSDLKNKVYDDLIKGKPEQYIEEELDPLTTGFINTVKSGRPQLAKLEDDDPVFRGETYLTDMAIEKGLIDAKMSFVEAILKADEFGKNFEAANKVKYDALKYV